MVRSHKVAEKSTCQVVTPPYGPTGAVGTPKIAKSVSLASHVRTYSPVAFCQQPAGQLMTIRALMDF